MGNKTHVLCPDNDAKMLPLKLAGGPRGALARSRATMKLKPTVTTTKSSYCLWTFTDGGDSIYRGSLMKDRSTKMDVK